MTSPTTADIAERNVLGAMLLDDLAVDDAMQALTDADYASARHGAIHHAIVTLASTGHPHDWLAVAGHLEAAGDLERVGGRSYLNGLVTGVVAPSSAGWYAGIVREASMKRAVRTEGLRLQTLGESDGPALDAINEARKHLDEVASRTEVEVSMPDAIEASLAALEADVGLPTPWQSLTDAIGGWYPGELAVTAARPGIGKSVVAIETALHCAEKQHKTAILFSLEMSRNEVLWRMYSNLGEVDNARMRHRALRESDWAKIRAAAERVRQMPLVVDDRSGLTLAQVRSTVRRHQLRGEVGLVVVDYLAKMRPDRDVARQDRRVQVDALASGLKNLAKDLQVPVMALAQLNRNIESRTDKRPVLSDLRESGGIEAEADVVMLMHRARDEREGDPSDLQMLVRKNRHGPEMDVPLTFVGYRSHIADQSGDYVEP